MTTAESAMPESLHEVVEDGIEGCCCRLTPSGAAWSCGLCVSGEHSACRDVRRRAER